LLWFALTPLGAWAQWASSAYIGKAYTADTVIHVTSPPTTDVTFNNVGFDDRSFESPLYYGLRLGCLVKGRAGFEGEFIHMKAFARVNEPVTTSGTRPVSGNATGTVAPAVVLTQYSVSHGLNLLLGNAVLRHEVAERLSITVRVGLGVAIPHAEIRAFGTALDEYQLHGAAIQFAGGGEFELTRRLFWFAEYKFTTTRQHFEIGSATIENTFATNHLVSGLGLRFR
jgi:lipid A oxidase